MTIKTCPCCGLVTQSKNYYIIGRNAMGLWLNCKACHSTVLLQNKPKIVRAVSDSQLLRNFDYRLADQFDAFIDRRISK